MTEEVDPVTRDAIAEYDRLYHEMARAMKRYEEAGKELEALQTEYLWRSIAEISTGSKRKGGPVAECQNPSYSRNDGRRDSFNKSAGTA